MLIAWDTTRSDPLTKSQLAGRVTGKKRASRSPPYSENYTGPPTIVGSLTPRPQRDRESGLCQSGANGKRRETHTSQATSVRCQDICHPILKALSSA